MYPKDSYAVSCAAEREAGKHHGRGPSAAPGPITGRFTSGGGFGFSGVLIGVWGLEFRIEAFRARGLIP